MTVPRDAWRKLCDQVADCVDRPRWHALAACRGKPPAMFFPSVSNAGRYDRRTVVAALDLCQRCPVQPECLHAAVERREKFGVWGGRVFGTKPGRSEVTA